MTKFTDDQLDRIYARTGGHCHICRGRMARANYGRPGTRGEWSVDHSVPQVKGGSHHLNNLYAAHWSCNSSKGAGANRSARAVHGYRQAPLAHSAKKEAVAGNAIAGGALGLLAGALIGGPVAAVICLTIGACVGADADPHPT